MDYKIVSRFPFRLIGFERIFSVETAYSEIPKYWEEIFSRYEANARAGSEPANACEKAFLDYNIGEYAVCIDDVGEGQFRYVIAGKYTGGEVPEGMTLVELPRCDWAVFDCVGPMPESLQTLNTRIFNEWLPNNPDYTFYGNASIEWYDDSDMDAACMHSAIWIPVQKK